MVFVLAILMLIISSGLEFSAAGEFNTEYLNKKNTTAVNGIFVILVVLSHYSQYAGFDGAWDTPYLALREHLNQMAVAPFLFYSGYGMMEAIRNKGELYVRKVPAKFWKLLLRMETAIILYLILAVILGIEYPIKQILLAFTLWTAVGNSNWYIFAVLGLYILIWAAFRLTAGLSGRRGRAAGIAVLFILSIAFVFVLMKAGRPGYCYNTIIIMPLGFLYSEFRKEIESVFMRSDLSYLLVLMCVCGIYIVSYLHRWDYGIEGYTVWAAAFTAFFILITSRVRIYNKLLEWFGVHIFSVYILQRIPMIILDHFGCIEHHKYFSLLAAFAVTLPLALVFEKLTDAMIHMIESKVSGNRVKTA